MEEKESTDLLVQAIKEQCTIMSDTYTENTRIMCETIKKLDRTKTVLMISVITVVFLFILLLIMLPV